MPNSDDPARRPNMLWLLAVAAVILLAIGIVPRVLRNSALQADAATEKHTKPLVELVRPETAPRSSIVNVPGTIEPIEQTAVNSRATGYADKVLVDIGDHVTAGQTLAIITAPDSDQEVVQARAQLIQSQASLAQSRANKLAGEETVAQDVANLSHATAALLTSRAQLLQLKAQLAQAIRVKGEQTASLTEAQANLDLDRVTNVRNQTLAGEGYVSRQTADQTQAQYKVGVATVESSEAAVAAADSAIESARAGVTSGTDNVRAAEADVRAAEAAVSTGRATVAADSASVDEAVSGINASQANLQRLVVLQNYERIVAPFAGVVTARNIDPGAYIAGGTAAAASTSVGSSGAGASATGAAASGNNVSGSSASSSGSGGSNTAGLFTIAQLQRLRIYINLPQVDAGLLGTKTPASITVPSVPGRTFVGNISHDTVALDPTSRTLVAEIQLDNPNGVLRPGMFSDVELTVPQASGILLVPDSALVTGAAGTQLILVGPENKLHYQNVTVGEDDGKNLQILAGLKLTDRVVSSPANGFQEGEEVQVQKSTGHNGRKKK